MFTYLPIMFIHFCMVIHWVVPWFSLIFTRFSLVVPQLLLIFPWFSLIVPCFSLIFHGSLPFFNGFLHFFYVFPQFLYGFHSFFIGFHWLFQSFHWFLHGVHWFFPYPLLSIFENHLMYFDVWNLPREAFQTESHWNSLPVSRHAPRQCLHRAPLGMNSALPGEMADSICIWVPIYVHVCFFL